MFVIHGGIEERLERAERIERMMDERVAILDLFEDAFGILRVPQRARHERRILQLGTLDAGQGHPVGEAEPRVDDRITMSRSISKFSTRMSSTRWGMSASTSSSDSGP